MVFVLLPSLHLGVVQKMTDNRDALIDVVAKMRGNPTQEAIPLIVSDPCFLSCDDVRHAMSAIGRIPKKDEHDRIISVDLHNVDLPNLNLERGDLQYATLWGSDLRNCVFYRADLREADLGGVDFTDASLELADLSRALMFWSNICEPIRSCILRRTRLAGAKLDGANLAGADLREALDLRPEQLRQAILNEHTQLPPGFQH